MKTNKSVGTILTALQQALKESERTSQLLRMLISDLGQNSEDNCKRRIQVIEAAMTLFPGDKVGAVRWSLITANFLAGVAPVNIDSDQELNLVLDTIARIKHGVSL